jgi:segregation and condensation protein A
MAATLMYIKSKMLIPTDPNIEEEIFEDPRAELVEKLLEYQKFKNAAELLQKREDKIFFRPKSQLIMDFGDTENWIDVKLFDLINIFSKLIQNTKSDEFIYVIPEKVTVSMKIDEIKKMLEIKKEFMFQNLFSENITLWEIVVTFIALLELVKQDFITVKQHKLFGDIKIFKREG